MSEPTSMTRDRRERLIDKATNILRTTGGAGGYTQITGAARTLTAEQVVSAAKVLEEFLNG